MKVVDDPSERVDKVMGDNVENKNMFSTLSPTTLTTLHPQRLIYTIITISNFFKKQTPKT